MTTTANLKAVTTTAHGMTEPIAKQFFDQKGKKGLAIIEFRSAGFHEALDDKDKVDLEILSFEVVDEAAEEHVRGLQRALFMNRKLKSEDEQLTLDSAEDLEPTVADVMAHGRQFTPHEFTSTGRGDDGEWLDECEVCGNEHDHTLHAEADELVEDEEPAMSA